MRRSATEDQFPPGPDRGGSDGARTPSRVVRSQAGRAPEAFAGTAGADALAGQGRREHSEGAARRSGAAAGHRDRAGTAPLGKAGHLPSQPTCRGGWLQRRASRSARGVAAPRGVAAEGDGRVAAPGDAASTQPAGRPRGTAGQRLERLQGAYIIRSWRRRGRRATSWTCGCARGRCTRRTAGSSRCWSGRSCICAGRRRALRRPGEPLMAALEERSTHSRVRNNAG